MKERPILFSSEMVRAILDGRKTMTRRVVKPQPEWCKTYWWYDEQPFMSDDSMQSHLFHDVYGNKGTPYGSVYGDGTADRLWVRETFGCHADTWGIDRNAIAYRADGERDNRHWRSPIHMPRWASRITLEITDVRVERVQDISAADAEAEGVFRHIAEHSTDKVFRDARAEQAVAYFRELWDSINGKKYPWESNPWTWVIAFKRV